MEDVVSRSLGAPRFRGLLLGAFAIVALLLSAIGVYGVVSHNVAQRSREIGVRMALGASHGDVFRLIAGEGLRLTLVGIGIGLGGAIALTWVLRSLLFGISAVDPLTFAALAA